MIDGKAKEEENHQKQIELRKREVYVISEWRTGTGRAAQKLLVYLALRRSPCEIVPRSRFCVGYGTRGS
jgi:hypothetical protein